MHPRTQSKCTSIVTGTLLLRLLSACSEPTRSRPDADPNPTIPNDGARSSDAASEQTGVSSCSAAADAASESAFVPAAVPNLPLDSIGGGLTLFSSTLTLGPNGLELYAGIRNESEFPLCGAALQIEFYDHDNQLMGTASGGVQSGRLYQLPDSTTTISCVAPGQTAMAAVMGLPEAVTLDALKSMGHRFPAFQINDAVPVPSATVSEVEGFRVAGGTAYRGTVTNAAQAPMSNPSVAVFSVNCVGRPLGFAMSTAMVVIPPGNTWSFETSAIAEQGVDELVFAAGSFPVDP